MDTLEQIVKRIFGVKGNAMTLEKWLEDNNISMKDFEGMCSVPYQRISEHIRLNKPLSEKHVLSILKATDCKVSPETLRPSLRPIFRVVSGKKRALERRTTGFAVALAIVLGVFATVIFQGPTEFSDSMIAESWQHFEQAQKAYDNGNLEFALSHLEAIEKRTPAWYESRDLHWQIKAELNTYAKEESQTPLQ